MLALTLVAVVMIGLGVSASGGLRLTAQSNARQAAVEVATRTLEQLRASDYAGLGLLSSTSWDGAGTPDDDVNKSVSPPTYTVPLDNPVTEPLILTGTHPHRPTSVTFGSRTFDLWQYVTWADQAKGEKRATVVVQYRSADADGRVNRVSLSSLYTAGEIEFRSSSSSTTSSSSSTSTSTTTTTAPPSSCSTNDGSGPSVSRFEIQSTTGPDSVRYVTQTGITIAVTYTEPCSPVRAELSGGAATSDVAVGASPTTLAYTLASTEGAHAVSGILRDHFGNLATPATDTVVLDLTNPTAPSSLSGSATKSGSSRYVELTWRNDSLDDDPVSTGTRYVASYAIYRKIGSSGGFAHLATVPVSSSGASGTCLNSATNCTYRDSGLSDQSYTYYVVAVDQAGRVSSKTQERNCVIPNSSTTVSCT